MINLLRTLVACAALAVGLWFVSSSAPAGTPDLPKDSYKKAADADLKFLQTRLDELAKSDEPLPRSAKPAVAVTLVLAAYADVLGDAAFKADVLKVGEAVNAKKYKDASEMAKKLTIKAGAGKAGGDLPKLAAFESAKDKDVTYLPTTMKLFSNTLVLKQPSGLNIEKDLKDWTVKAAPPKLDPAAVEILATRSAVINEFAFHNPNEKARNTPKTLKEWQDFSKQSVDLSKELAVEAAKGKTADLKMIRAKLTLLEAACTNCHSKFRFDD